MKIVVKIKPSLYIGAFPRVGERRAQMWCTITEQQLKDLRSKRQNG